jgi:hypothetical protein
MWNCRAAAEAPSFGPSWSAPGGLTQALAEMTFETVNECFEGVRAHDLLAADQAATVKKAGVPRSKRPDEAAVLNRERVRGAVSLRAGHFLNRDTCRSPASGNGNSDTAHRVNKLPSGGVRFRLMPQAGREEPGFAISR